MNKKTILALFLSSLTSVSNAALFDVPLAKKCYLIYERLIVIGDTQILDKCREKLQYATFQTEEAALAIANDQYSAIYNIDYAIQALRHAQVYSCEKEDEIVEVEKNLTSIKNQLE
ncbi:hypothetical protein [Legionella maioricensis]|uniref:Uncharacterized protein n=1 Tax=Legionella maioricensis TaxID=2896528 RepID=A0A9X2CZ04_9GAMM|nr:hypothetical protein [Legionella maioricensis]MCL9682902.1 hypothetical protein [Legionella maioricensis]MCL9686470.1 hypothetical protein [Legionella maioricensis]